MRVISVAKLRDFGVIHPGAEQPLKAWFAEAKLATWQNPAELKVFYGSASILQHGRVVFNISGNKYRLVVAISYITQVLLIKFVGTHKEYDAIDAQTINLNHSEGAQK